MTAQTLADNTVEQNQKQQPSKDNAEEALVPRLVVSKGRGRHGAPLGVWPTRSSRSDFFTTRY